MVQDSNKRGNDNAGSSVLAIENGFTGSCRFEQTQTENDGNGAKVKRMIRKE